jgi:glycosyltransferase involved in cell wall biosynthesis
MARSSSFQLSPRDIPLNMDTSISATASNKRLRVGILTSTYARASDDPQVPWMRELNNRVKNTVDHLVVMAPSYKGLKSHEIDGVCVERFRYAPKSIEALTHDEGAPNKTRRLGPKLLAIPYLLCGIIAVFVWSVKHRINVIHVHWPFPHGIWALLPKYLLGIKIVSFSHGAELAMARRSSRIRKLLGWLLRNCDECLANSSHTATEVHSVSGVTAKIIPYGTSIEVKTGASPKSNGSDLLLFCGRLVQRKGIDVLLRAMPTIMSKRDVQLVITGEGDCKDQWMKLSSELQLDKAVRFAGFVDNEELTDLYQQCSVYVHPAIFDDRGDTEGLGVVLVEALAYQRPVVASAVGGIVDVIIHEKTGLLVPEKDPSALAEAVLRVLEDKSLAQRLGNQGLEHVKQFFDWQRIADQTYETWQKTISGESDPKTH